MNPAPIELFATCIFALALVHTFGAAYVARLAHRFPAHRDLFHLLGETEVVFALWALILLLCMALGEGSAFALQYAESRNYTEPAFVFVVMVMAASRPILLAVSSALHRLARCLPIPAAMTMAWLGLALVPLLGSLITEPAAMTIAALTLGPVVFRKNMPEPQKYLALGVLLVNISIGGTLTAYAAPPVLMVAARWEWSSMFMLGNFGWKAALAVLINATAAVFLVRRWLTQTPPAQHENSETSPPPIPPAVTAIHIILLAIVVICAHHSIIFIGVFLFFLGFTQACRRWQSPLLIREATLVACFLSGLVLLGGMQRWWLQPIVSTLEPLALFFGALGLTAITDNAALTYLGSLVQGISNESKYMLMAGAVAGGGLTVIANAPNPAGIALLKPGFANGAVAAGPLLLGAILPTTVAATFFLLL